MEPQEGRAESGLSSDKERLLSLVNFLQPLPPDEIRDLAQRTAEVHLDTGQNLFTLRYTNNMLFVGSLPGNRIIVLNSVCMNV